MSDDPVSAEEVAHRRFAYSFRGFDTGEVRAYLDRVAEELRTSVKRERELHRRVADAEHRAAHPVIDEDVLTRTLGEETSRILASAHEVARELKSKAEENAARILREAHAEAQRIRASAEGVLVERSEEAELAAEEIRQAARSEVESTVSQARQEAKAVVTEAGELAERMVKEAEAASARVLNELSRRRRIAHAQVEQLRAGRERLLEAYRVVRRTLEEVGDELQRAEPEARLAAEAVARRTGIDLDHLEDADVISEGSASVSVAAARARSLTGSTLDETLPDPGPAIDLRSRTELGALSMAPEIPADEALDTPAPDSEAQDAPAQDTPAPDSEAEDGTAQSDMVTASRRSPRPEQRQQTALMPEPEPAAPGDAPANAPSAVAELFARIKADRTAAVAEAEEVLADDRDTRQPPDAPSSDRRQQDEGNDELLSGQAPVGNSDDEDEAVLQRRDTALESITSRLSRKLKRSLQDEQNEILDRLRSHQGRPPLEALPASAEQVVRYRRTSADLLEEAAVAGARFVSPGASTSPDIGELADGLADSLVAPLRRRLQRVLAGENGEDPPATAERISASYREWKSQLVDRLAGDATISAFSRGTVQAAPGALLRWVVDDDGGPCPDCYDNALAGPTPSGVAYPTGQEHPPAHAGCRCLLVPASP
ncbi:MAG: DivIVA domain-containing protein [Actinomycetota bacterium]|nr:DivIVA domain-containing protein [Actinomycetota bacterium]